MDDLHRIRAVFINDPLTETILKTEFGQPFYKFIIHLVLIMAGIEIISSQLAISLIRNLDLLQPLRIINGFGDRFFTKLLKQAVADLGRIRNRNPSLV